MSEDYDHVIYMGMPGKLYKDNRLTGLAAYMPKVATNTEEGPQFKFLAYDGTFTGYLHGLWFFLFGDHDSIDSDYR